jgi:flavin-dependent dehydrogenase
MICKGVTLFSPAGTVVQGRISQAGSLAGAAARALDEEESRASMYYDKLWRKEFSFHEFTLGYALQPLLNNQFLLESLMRFAAKKQTRANLLAGLIGHNLKKRDLLKLIPPFS